MSDEQTRCLETPSLELRPLGRDAKSLKHKHKSKGKTKCLQQQKQHSQQEKCGGNSAELKRSSTMSSPGRHYAPNKRSVGVNREDALRELLTGKIAELEVGGDETLDDLSGMYVDEAVPIEMKNKAASVKESEEMAAEEKVEALAGSLNTASEQVTLLQKKLSELNAKCILLKQRKGAVSSELVKSNALRTKLEQLCRELQKQNKFIVTEIRRIADEEDQKRRDLSARFQKRIEEVSTKMDKQGQDYVASLKENENLHQKLKTFREQYTAREEYFQRQLEAKDLAIQLADTKLRHQVELTSCEAEKVRDTLEMAKEFSNREVQLQAQLNSYAEKFDVVQETLAKSNEMFTTFRDEMERMAKTTKMLEKENLALKKKCAAYDSGAIASIQGKVASAKETLKLHEKIKKLESLCRHLQAERKSIQQDQHDRSAAAAALRESV